MVDTYMDKTVITGKYPILHVKGFDKIRSASIELSPMTLFIGDNNSGKSYLMSLIYGLKFLNFGYLRTAGELTIGGKAEDLQLTLFDNESPLLSLFMIDFVEGEKANIEIDDSLFKKVVQYINRVLMREKDKIIEFIFNTRIEIESMWLELPFKEDMSFSMEVVHVPVTPPEEEPEPRLMYGMAFKVGQEIISEAKLWINPATKGKYPPSPKTYAFGMFMTAFYMSYMKKTTRPSSIYFLPSSRTGFMLTHKNIVGDLIERSGMNGFAQVHEEPDGDKTRALYLTKPVIDFLRFIATVRTEKSPKRFGNALQLLLSEVIEGDIAVLGTTQEFRYTPKGTNDLLLPLYVSSGVVTELASLVLTLQSGNPYELFIEEPEISLHPQLQLLIARVMVRIKSEGANLFVSTHSDTIIQHLNNMIKLTGIRDEKRKKALMKKYGYLKEDLLNPSEIGMYQFTVDHDTQKTTVTPLVPGEYGFSVPTFSKTFNDLISEIADIEDEE